MNIRLYEINPTYIAYLSTYAPHLFHNKQSTQIYSRKYVGIILTINSLNYFAPLSSYKPKHPKINASIDLIKLKDYAVINLNNMLPVPQGLFSPVDIPKEKNPHYKALLQSEYRIIKSLQHIIFRNARIVYQHKICHGNSTPLAQRCNDFLQLGNACRNYSK